ncbi:MAG: DUF935 family protein [Elusimicrobia bacterium]|nr:DUF935 family protein [Elusimicrobiota bacterium]
MFEKAIERARSAYGGGELVRLRLEQPPPKPAAIRPTQIVQGFIVPDADDRWLYRSGQPEDPNQIKQFVSFAESAGETRFLFAVYEEMYSRDAHIRAECGKKSANVLSARRDVLPMPATFRKKGVQQDTPESQLSHECSDYVESQIYAPGVDFEGAIAFLCSADLFGIAVLEVVAEPGAGPDGKEQLRALKRVPQQRLRVTRGGTSWEVRTVGDTWVPLKFLQEIGAAIVLEYEPNLVSPARRGLFRSILPLWLMRTQGPLWWGRAVELFGMPMRIATTTTGAEPKQDAAIQFDQSGAEPFMALPPGVDVKYLEALRGDMPHERFLEWAAKEISKVIHHSTQHADIQKGAGSTASADSQVEVMQTSAQETANRVATAMTEQLFGGLVSRNFGYEIARTYTPELRLRVKGSKSADDMLKSAQALDMMQKIGMSLSPAWAHDFLSTPQPADAEDPLEPVAPTPPSNLFPFPGGGAGGGQDMDGSDGQGADGKPMPKQLRASRRGVRTQAKDGKELVQSLEDKAAEDAWKAGRELLKPYVELLDRASAEEWPLPQLLSRILHLHYGKGASTAELRDILAAVIAEAELRGLTEVRRSRG